MRKTISTVLSFLLVLMAVMASCSLDDGNNYDPNVYIGGVYFQNAINDPNERRTCYWANGAWHNLQNGTSDNEFISPKFITVANNKVYVIIQNDCYWVDGVRYNIPASELVVSNNKIYTICWDNNGYFVDGVEKSIDNFSVSAITENDGKVYFAGRYEDNGTFYASYYVDGDRTDIAQDTDEFEFYPYFITVTENGKVYIAGTGYSISTGENFSSSSADSYYYTEGKFYKLEDSHVPSLLKMVVSKGKVYGVGREFSDTSRRLVYWVDGKKIIPGVPGGQVFDITVSNGKVYMAGWYGEDNPRACYWVDGVRHDLPSIGVISTATSIFVAE